MPLTLAEAKSLAMLGIVIPPDILERKAREEKCRARRLELTTAAAGKPPEWMLRGEITAALDRAEAAENRRDLDAAFAELDSAAEILERPAGPPPAPESEPVIEPAVAEAPPPPPPPAPPPVPAGTENKPVPRVKAASGGNVVFQQSRIAWQNACKVVQLELARLEKSILSASGDSPNAKEIAAKANQVLDALGGLDEKLQDKLDEAVAATSDEDRERLRGEARDLIGQIRSFADADPLLRVIDNNPFGSFNVKGMVSTTLQTLAEKFG
jgi:hypothetical protein